MCFDVFVLSDVVFNCLNICYIMKMCLNFVQKYVNKKLLGLKSGPNRENQLHKEMVNQVMNRRGVYLTEEVVVFSERRRQIK